MQCNQANEKFYSNTRICNWCPDLRNLNILITLEIHFPHVSDISHINLKIEMAPPLWKKIILFGFWLISLLKSNFCLTVIIFKFNVMFSKFMSTFWYIWYFYKKKKKNHTTWTGVIYFYFKPVDWRCDSRKKLRAVTLIKKKKNNFYL